MKKKTFTLIALLILISVTLAACTENTLNEPTPTPEGNVSRTFFRDYDQGGIFEIYVLLFPHEWEEGHSASIKKKVKQITDYQFKQDEVGRLKNPSI